MSAIEGRIRRRLLRMIDDKLRLFKWELADALMHEVNRQVECALHKELKRLKRSGPVTTPPQPPPPAFQLCVDSAELNKKIERLAPRLRQTLDRMLMGDSEKQIALALGISKHTVHVYVKSLYRWFNASSRGELTARLFIKELRGDTAEGQVIDRQRSQVRAI